MQPARVAGRGHYDRGLSPSERVQQQRALIYNQTLALLALPSANVASLNLEIVCREAGVGRNTVYGLFESTSGLVARCLVEAAEACGRHLEQARELNTPVEDVRALTRNWLALPTVMPLEAPALLNCARPALVRLAADQLRDVLSRGVAAGTFAPDFEPLRLGLLSEAFVGALALRERTESAEGETAIALSLAELVVRACR